MPNFTMVLTGDKELNRRLSVLKGPKQKEAVRKSARAALRPVQQAVKSALPSRSGRLRKNVKIRTLRRSKLRIGARVTTGFGNNDFGGKAFYGGFLEWGWKTGSRRRSRARIEAKIVRDLRTQSRRAKALSEKGSAFRARQEAYFRREASYQASQQKIPERRQIAGKYDITKAANRVKSQALQIYRTETISWIEKLSKG